MNLRLKLCRLLVLLPVLLPLLVVTPVLAGDPPDPPSEITIESVKAYEGLWEAGDMLFLIEYKVMYTPDPTQDPQDTFLVGIWDGTTKGPDRALDYYQHNFTSIYMTPAQVASFGYVLNDELKVRVLGNPSIFPSLSEGVDMRTTTLTAGRWLKGSSLDITRGYLADWSIVLARDLEESWGITLLTSGGKLNSTGMVKFKEAIPGLDSICPTIFQVYSSYPGYEDPTYTKSFETTLQGRMGARLEAVLDGLGQWVVGKPNMGRLVGGAGLALIFFVLSGRIFIATGSVPTSIVVSLPFLFAGNIIGILPLSITFIAAFLVALFFSVTFILGRL